MGRWIKKRSRGEAWEGQRQADWKLGRAPEKGLGGMPLRGDLYCQSGVLQKPLHSPVCPCRILDSWYDTISVNVGVNMYMIPYPCCIGCDPGMVAQA